MPEGQSLKFLSATNQSPTPTTMNPELTEALHYDPIAHAEHIAGKSCEDDSFVVILGMGLMHQANEKKSALLFLNRDTNSWRQTLDEWDAIILDLGFQKVYDEPIPATDDRNRIFWHPDGILLHSDTFHGSVNSAKAYLFVKGNNRADISGGGSFGWIKYDEATGSGVAEVSKDVREGFRHFLDGVRAGGEILPKWPKIPFLWLLHHEDVRHGPYDHNAINAGRIACLPEHVRAAITP